MNEARAAFERHIGTHRHPEGILWRRGGSVFAEDIPEADYVDGGLQHRWVEWQAAWNAARSPAPVAAGAALIDEQFHPDLRQSIGMVLTEKLNHMDGLCMPEGVDWNDSRHVDEVIDAVQGCFAVWAEEHAAADPMSQPAAHLPAEVRAITAHLRTQDNRCTEHPLFAVQQKRVIGGLHPDYATNTCWVDYDGEVPAEEAARLDELDSAGKPLPNGARKLGYIEIWEFVTGCFTEQGCKDYIAINGHNLKEPRIYAYGAYRNREFITLRQWLLAASPAAPGGLHPVGQA